MRYRIRLCSVVMLLFVFGTLTPSSLAHASDGPQAVVNTAVVLLDQHLKGQVARSWDNAAPAWSPDGTQIAFLSNRNGAYEIWVMNADREASPADGSGQHPLLTAAALTGLNIQYDGVDERVISWR